MYSDQIKSLKTGATEKPTREKTAISLTGFCAREDVNGVKVKDVYTLFLEYCKESGIKPSSPQEFGRAMVQAFDVKTKNVRFGSEVCKVFFTD